MTVERTGTGKEERFFIDGLPISRENLEEGFRDYFSEASWQKVMKDAAKFGRVHIGFVFVNNGQRLQDKLDLANKKIATLEHQLADLISVNKHLIDRR